MLEEGTDAAGGAISVGLDALNRLVEEADDFGAGRIRVRESACVELAEGDPEAARARQRLRARPFTRRGKAVQAQRRGRDGPGLGSLRSTSCSRSRARAAARGGTHPRPWKCHSLGHASAAPVGHGAGASRHGRGRDGHPRGATRGAESRAGGAAGRP